MPYYVRQGKIPRKRHSIFRSESGQLLPEQLVGNKGFVGISSLLYHLRPPTTALSSEHLRDVALEADPERRLRHRHFRLHRLPTGGSPVLDRVPLMFNGDVASYLVQPDREDDFFYRNSQGDELIYVTQGEGVLETQFGELPFAAGDYLVIPRSVLHRYRFTSENAIFLILEAGGYFRTPGRYRNEHGQMIEGAPFSERDIRAPQNLRTHDETGEFPVVVKQYDALTRIVLDHHPLDVVGWDGFFFPWALSIHDFEPLVGRFHQPPPVHQTFANDGFVVCSFCPRPYDFDPQAVPAPYNHSNVMSDEVLYYVSQEFMSRSGIEFGSLTLHPDGVPHGPHPGRAEASIGAQGTDELAVMFDTFRPLQVAQSILTVEDDEYFQSWVHGDHG
ncbi:MAG: homogentisate 1,2-dioxygenase [Acidobacteriota bacterium]